VLTVGDFGRYREFLLYASLLQSIASFSISDRPAVLHSRTSRQQLAHRKGDGDSDRRRQHVHHRWLLYSRFIVTGGRAGGAIPIAGCAVLLLFVNVDFWESSGSQLTGLQLVFIYTASRLIVRMLVVVRLRSA